MTHSLIPADAWDARLAGLRVAAEARAAAQRGEHDHAAAKKALAAGHQALEQTYRQRRQSSLAGGAVDASLQVTDRLQTQFRRLSQLFLVNRASARNCRSNPAKESGSCSATTGSWATRAVAAATPGGQPPMIHVATCSKIF